jgi:hypothetical protein
MPVETILLITLTSTLVLLTIGSLPIWPHSAGWSYYPASASGVVLLSLLLLLFLGEALAVGERMSSNGDCYRSRRSIS